MSQDKDLIQRYNDILTPENCEEVIKNIEYLKDNNLMYYDKEYLHKQNHMSINLIDDWEVDLLATSKISDLILPNIKNCVDNYIETFSVLKESKFILYDLKIKKIPMGGGFHAWHYENGGVLNAQRAFVVQVYLNDSFDGGETEFLYQNRREQARAGDVLIFPAGFTHTHRGNPPINGSKYIATSWGMMQDYD